MKANYLKTRIQSVRGSVLFFVAFVVVPLIFFAFSLSLDISKYYREHQRIQTVLDAATLYGYRFLPFQTQARRAVDAYLSQHRLDPAEVAVSIGSDSVALSYNGAAELLFAKFFGVSAGIPLALFSESKGTPFDAFILMDTSTYLAPEILNGQAWGTETDWPPAQFFSTTLPIYHEDAPLNPRLVTQQCFNSAFSALKLAAISTFEFLGSISGNAVGIGMFPGYINFIDEVRPVTLPTALPIGDGEANMSVYVGPHLRNSYCAAAAEQELGALHYRFPEANAELSPGRILPNRPASIAVPPTWDLDLDYLPYARAREVIWARPVSENQIGNGIELMREVRSRLLGANFYTDRSGFEGRSAKVALIFAGDVPRLGGARYPDAAIADPLEAELNTLRQNLAGLDTQTSVSIYYILFRHLGNLPDLDSRVEALRQMFARVVANDGNPVPNLELRLLFLENPGDASNRLASLLVLKDKTAVLAR